MFDRLIEGRGAIEATPPGHTGRMVRLQDGTIIGYRPAGRSTGRATIDINIPGFNSVRRLHY